MKCVENPSCQDGLETEHIIGGASYRAEGMEAPYTDSNPTVGSPDSGMPDIADFEVL